MDICMPLTAQQPIRSSFSQESETGKFLDSKMIQKEKGKNSHLILTSDQQLPVDGQDNFYWMKVLVSQIPVAPLLKRTCDLGRI